MDRRYDPDRTAKKILGFQADIVALQEVDVGHERSGYVNQAAYIADRLGMSHTFISHHLFPKDVQVPMEFESRMVSDHLPLYAEIALR